MRAAQFDSGDDDAAKFDKLENLLGRSGADVSAAAPILALLLSLPAGVRYGALTLTPAQRKAQTFETLIDHFTALAERGPVLMLFEDVHWIDPTTEELLKEIVFLIVDRPVMVVIAHRPEWQTGLQSVPHATPLVLNRLRRARTAEQASSLHAVWEAISEYWSALILLDRMSGSSEIEPRRISILLPLIEQGSYFWRNEAERSMALRHLDSAIGTASEAGQLATLARLQAYRGNSWER